MSLIHHRDLSENSIGEFRAETFSVHQNLKQLCAICVCERSCSMKCRYLRDNSITYLPKLSDADIPLSLQIMFVSQLVLRCISFDQRSAIQQHLGD